MILGHYSVRGGGAEPWQNLRAHGFPAPISSVRPASNPTRGVAVKPWSAIRPSSAAPAGRPARAPGSRSPGPRTAATTWPGPSAAPGPRCGTCPGGHTAPQPLAGQPGQAEGPGLRPGAGAAQGRGYPLPRLLQRRAGGQGQRNRLSARPESPQEAQERPPAGQMAGGRGETRLQPSRLVLGLHDGHRAVRRVRPVRQLRLQVHRQGAGPVTKW